MNSFGQEFYPYESIRALKLAEKTRVTDRRALVDALASQWPQHSEITRSRIAAKLVQRYLTGNRTTLAPPPHQQPFVRLVARSRHTPTQIELLFWRLSTVDGIVGALARELFYPACVVGRPPDGYSAAEFAAGNGGQLFATTPLLTRSFIVKHARTRWNFSSTATLDRSLRVLQGAGLIARERMTELRGHPTAFRLSHHDVSLTTFIWALYDEFLPHATHADFALSPAVLPVADFARTLLLSREQVEAHIAAARRQQLLARDRSSDGLRLVFGSLDALADTLLTKAL